MLEGLRILVMADLYAPFQGGGEKSTQWLIQRLHDCGAHIEVVTMTPEMAGRDVDLPYAVHRFPAVESPCSPDLIPTLQNNEGFYGCTAEMLAEVSQWDPFDVIIGYRYWGGYLGLMSPIRVLSELWKVPFGTYWHDPGGVTNSHAPHPVFYANFELFNSQHYQQVADEALDSMNQATRTFWMPPPLDPEDLSSYHYLADEWQNRPYDFGYINCSWTKGLSTVQRLAGLLPDRKFLLKTGGHGVQQTPKLFDNITYEGWFPTMDDFYRQCKVILYPSYKEGYGMIPFEAAANGCLVVANDHPIIREASGSFATLVDGYDHCTRWDWQYTWKYRFSNTEWNAMHEKAADEWEFALDDLPWADPSESIEKGLVAVEEHQQLVEKQVTEFIEYLEGLK